MLHIATYVLLAGALFYDFRERRIPNFLTLPAALGGFALQGMFYGWPGLQDALLGCGLGLAILLPLFATKKFGAGDVKLLAAVGALRGLNFIWRAGLLGAMAGGVLAVAVLAYHKELGASYLGFVTGTYRSQRTYPYAPAIALGVLLADLGWLL
jgi:prepilin peptidase CpaA